MNPVTNLILSWLVGALAILMLSIDRFIAAVLLWWLFSLRKKVDQEKVTEHSGYSPNAQMLFVLYWGFLAIALFVYPDADIAKFIRSNPYWFMLLFIFPFLPSLVFLEISIFRELVKKE